MSKTLTAMEVMAARDDRARRQKELLAAYGAPLVSFTLNLPGDEKDGPLIRRFFQTRLAVLRERLAGMIRAEETLYKATGPEYLAALTGDQKEIKRLCVALEEEGPWGRLLDLDVIGPESASLSRTALGLPERGCLVCGRPGRTCAAGQAHSYEELKKVVWKRMADYFREEDPRLLAGLATRALIGEARVTPKPGLVDTNNSGSHRDMDLALMEKSARALTPYFEKCVRIGMETALLAPEKTFPPLREAGKKAEEAMIAATGGVNTHKGAIYLFGILLGALGRLWQPEAMPDVSAVLEESGRVAKQAVEKDLESIARLPEDALTAGQRLYRNYGFSGARGEAAAGFPALGETALPYLAAHRGEKDVYPRLLLRLIARGTDSNLYARGGKKGAENAVKAVRALLAEGEPSLEEIEELDRDFIRENLSPGGSADLLALALFCERMIDPETQEGVAYAEH